MDKARLVTRDGNHIIDITIPVFNPRAEIIVWGDRHFIYKGWEIDHTYVVYSEAMAFFVPVNAELIERLKGEPLSNYDVNDPRFQR